MDTFCIVLLVHKKKQSFKALHYVNEEAPFSVKVRFVLCNERQMDRAKSELHSWSGELGKPIGQPCGLTSVHWTVSKHQNSDIKTGNIKALWSWTLRLMTIGTLPCVKISLDHRVFGLCLIWHSERYANISSDQRLTLRPNWVDTSPCLDLRMEAGPDSKIFCSVYSSKYLRESRHPVILV